MAEKAKKKKNRVNINKKTKKKLHSFDLKYLFDCSTNQRKLTQFPKKRFHANIKTTSNH